VHDPARSVFPLVATASVQPSEDSKEQFKPIQTPTSCIVPANHLLTRASAQTFYGTVLAM
jgi:hypothetical protein